MLAACDSDLAARESVRLFTLLLGRVCGDLCLAAGAWGGVYLFGSAACAWSRVAPLDQFAAQFTAKGKMRRLMKNVSCSVVDNDLAPLIGLAKEGC